MYWLQRLWCVLTPNATSSALSAVGCTCPLNRAIIASAGLPGMSRGRKKLIVRATQSVTAKKPRLRSRNLNAAASFRRCRGRSLQVQMEQHLLDVRHCERRRTGVRIPLRGPPRQALVVVLVPVDRLRRRYDGNVLQHRLLDLLDQRHLSGLVGSRELVEQFVHVGVEVALVVGPGVLPERRRVRPVEDLPQLVVRGGTAGLPVVGEVEVALVELVVVGLLGKVTNCQIDPEWLQLLLHLDERRVP